MRKEINAIKHRRKQKLDKIDELHKLIGCYYTVITDIVSKIYEHEKICSIETFKENKSHRSSSFLPLPGGFHYINLLIHEDKKIMIWELFHEHGHQQDVPLRAGEVLLNDDTPTERVIERELYAWRRADIELHSHSELKDEIKSYTAFKVAKLGSYGLELKDLNVFHNACNHLNLSDPSYETVFYRLVKMVYNAGCKLDYGNEDIKYEKISSHTQDYRNGDNFKIHLKKDSSTGNNKDFIWDLLHEFGHSLDEPLTISQKELEKDIELRNKRELNAWIEADRIFKDQYELRNDLEEYTAYKENCLKTYGLTLEDLKNHSCSK